MSIAIPFVKASACGNDFLMIDGHHAEGDIGELTRKLCDRHNGVGADGVEWLFPDKNADVCARLINADGSEAEISGNGTRCVAAYLCSESHQEKVAVQTGAGLKICRLISHNDKVFEFETEMGKPEVGREITVNLSSGRVPGIPVSMGNPHFVVFVEQFAGNWQAQAAEIGRDPQFKHGVNVEFVKLVVNREIEIRLFERGVGETQSSGTGSCAAASAAIAASRTQSPVRVHAPGGSQLVRWEDQIYLRGPAQIVCRGEFLS